MNMLFTDVVASNNLPQSLTLVMIATLLALLTQKEVLSGLKGTQSYQRHRTLNIIIVPMLLAFIGVFITLIFGIQ